jgi:uncharacterized protein (DUF58 family)
MSHVGRLLDPALVERLNQLQLGPFARSLVQGAAEGRHRAPVSGASVEFRQHRSYVPGDEPRRLDWRVLARTDRPFVREFDEETNLRCLLLLDRSGSMAYAGAGGRSRPAGAGKFHDARRLAAAMAYLMLAEGESVGLSTFDVRPQPWLAPHRGSAQLSRMVQSLERARTAGSSDLVRVTTESAERLDRRALVVIISDLFAPATLIRQALARLRHDRHELLLLRVLHRDEVEFPFRHWTHLRGLEGERPRRCDAALARKTYLDNFRRHDNALRELCGVLRVELATFVTDQPLADAIASFLKRRAATPPRAAVR